MNIANRFTMLRLALIPVFAILMIFHLDTTLWPLLVFAVASFTDFLDGHLARKYELVTTFGKFVDPLADKMLVITAFIFLIPEVPAWMVLIVVLRELIISGFRILAASEGVTIAASPWGKAKTVSQFAVILLLLFARWRGLVFTMPIDTVLLYISTGLTLISLVDYIVKNISVLDLENI